MLTRSSLYLMQTLRRARGRCTSRDSLLSSVRFKVLSMWMEAMLLVALVSYLTLSSSSEVSSDTGLRHANVSNAMCITNEGLIVPCCCCG